MSEPLTKELWITTKWRVPRNACKSSNLHHHLVIIDITNIKTGEITRIKSKSAAKKFMGISSHHWITNCLETGETIRGLYTVRKVEQDE